METGNFNTFRMEGNIGSEKKVSEKRVGHASSQCSTFGTAPFRGKTRPFVEYVVEIHTFRGYLRLDHTPCNSIQWADVDTPTARQKQTVRHYSRLHNTRGSNIDPWKIPYLYIYKKSTANCIFYSISEYYSSTLVNRRLLRCVRHMLNALYHVYMPYHNISTNS